MIEDIQIDQFEYLDKLEYVYLLFYENNMGVVMYDMSDIKNKNYHKMAIFDNITTLFRYADKEKIELIYIKHKQK